jgi:hypothetical protein
MLRIKDYICSMLRFAIEQLCFKGVMIYNTTSSSFELSSHSYSTFACMTHIEKHVFWLAFAHGVETLLMVLCVTHDLIKPANRHEPQSIKTPTIPSIINVLKCVRKPIVVYEETDFPLWSIDFGSSSKAIKKLKDLPINVLDSKSVQSLQERIECFMYVRRNFNAHMVNPIQTLEISGDMTNVYVPMLNTMMQIITNKKE